MFDFYYILGDDGRTPVHADMDEWARWYETADRLVRKDTIGGVLVSTVFLGMNHALGSGPPLLFETMIFGGGLDGYQDRCSTWQQAEAMHATACRLVRTN